MAERTCSIEGCERPHNARGWCTTHYERWRRHGDPLKVIPAVGRTDGDFMLRSEIEERFWPKVHVPANPLDCWNWLGGDRGEGYGQFFFKKKNHFAHRISYELSVGTIGPGLQIDHLCRNRGCVNPLHLQAVPAAINIQRKPRSTASHCPAGHPYSGDNLRMSTTGRRECRACGIERALRRRQAKRSA